MIAKFLSKSLKFSHDASGATAIEYGLIAAGISIIIIGGVAVIGGQLQAVFQNIGAVLGG
jgi:pilus assembly protein Flp/PilA